MAKDVRYTEKRVDEAWKSSVSEESSRGSSPRRPTTPEGHLNFSSFITSLAVQALMSMGELAASESEQPAVDLDAARQTIDLLLMLQKKTEGNLDAQEGALLKQAIADLQMKFVAHAST